MRIEYERTDVLQNIEFVVAEHFREFPDTTDYAVLRVYEALIDAYSGERIGRPPREWTPTEQEQLLYRGTKDMCEWWLGRNQNLLSGPHGAPQAPREAIDIETLLLCLKRLRKSVDRWTRRSGRQGYLGFMSQFVK